MAQGIKFSFFFALASFCASVTVSILFTFLFIITSMIISLFANSGIFLDWMKTEIIPPYSFSNLENYHLMGTLIMGILFLWAFSTSSLCFFKTAQKIAEEKPRKR